MKKLIIFLFCASFLLVNTNTVFAGGLDSSSTEVVMTTNSNPSNTPKKTTRKVTKINKPWLPPFVDESKLKATVQENIGKDNIPKVLVRPARKFSYVWTDSQEEDIYYTSIEPAIFAYYKKVDTTKDYIDNRVWLYNVWRSSGPAPIIPEGKSATSQWNGGREQRAVFTAPGDYKVTATEYQKWNKYTRYTYNIQVIQAEIEAVYYNKNVVVSEPTGTGEGENPTTQKSFNLKISTQDVGILSTIRNIDTTKEYDADVMLVQ